MRSRSCPRTPMPRMPTEELAELKPRGYWCELAKRFLIPKVRQSSAARSASCDARPAQSSPPGSRAPKKNAFHDVVIDRTAAA